jgi:hypothetical protein
MLEASDQKSNPRDEVSMPGNGRSPAGTADRPLAAPGRRLVATGLSAPTGAANITVQLAVAPDSSMRVSGASIAASIATAAAAALPTKIKP